MEAVVLTGVTKREDDLDATREGLQGVAERVPLEGGRKTDQKSFASQSRGVDIEPADKNDKVSEVFCPAALLGQPPVPSEVADVFLVERSRVYRLPGQHTDARTFRELGPIPSMNIRWTVI